MKSKFLILPILFIFAIVGVFFLFQDTGSLIGCSINTGSSSSINLVGSEDIVWNNFQTKIMSSYLGSMTYPSKEYVNGYYRKTHCGTGGGEKTFFISNNYQVGESLILNSELSHIKQDSFNYGSENYIKAEIDIKEKGNLILDYSSSSSGFDDWENGYLMIDSEKIITSGVFNMTIDNPRKVKIIMTTIAPHSGLTNDKSSVSISFKGKEVSSIDEWAVWGNEYNDITIETPSSSNSFFYKIFSWLKNFFSFNFFPSVSALDYFNDSNISEEENKFNVYDNLKNISKRKSYDSSKEKIFIKKNDLSKESIVDYELLANGCDSSYRECFFIINVTFHKEGMFFDVLNYHRVIDGVFSKGKVRKESLFLYTPNQTKTVEREIENCSDVINGSQFCSISLVNETIILPEWTSVDKKEIYNSGDSHIFKVEVEKSPHHVIDWILDVFGNMRLEEWALWFGDGGETWQNVTLNSPDNNSVDLDGIVEFSCSASNNETTLENISLWTNEGGTWEVRNSTTFSKTEVAESTGLTFASDSIGSSYGGMRLEANEDVVIYSFTKDSSSTATKGYILDSSSSVLTSATFSGHIVTFSTPYTLTGGSTYWLATDNNGGSFTAREKDPQTYPLNKAKWNYTGARRPNGQVRTDVALEVKSVNYSEPLDSSCTEVWNRTITEEIIWSCSSCDSDGDCSVGNATENRTISLDYPNISIISPSGSFSSKSFNVIANITALGELDYCYFNVTSWSGTEIENTEIPNCNESVLANVSDYDDYTIHVFSNTTYGFTSISSNTFSVDLEAPTYYPSGGSSSDFTDEEIAEIKNMLDGWKKFFKTKDWKDISPYYFDKYTASWNEFWVTFSLSSCTDFFKYFWKFLTATQGGL